MSAHIKAADISAISQDGDIQDACSGASVTRHPNGGTEPLSGHKLACLFYVSSDIHIYNININLNKCVSIRITNN